MGLSTQTLVFPLTERSVKQVFDYGTDTASYRLMYASGARIPVWYPDAELLLKAAHQAKRAEITAKAAGFGKEAER